MFTAPSGTPPRGWARGIVPRLDRLKFVSRDARLALGSRTGAVAIVAGVVAALSSLLSLAAIGLSRADERAFATIATVIGTAGWLGAGVLLIFLFGRAAIANHRRSVDARTARDMLQETLEALPAGVVVFDPDERLVMFNSAAESVTPALRQSHAIGRNYMEIARETARLMEAGGMGCQPWRQWLEHFRAKNRRRTLQCHDGRWIECNEKATPSGYTVGLRVDVSELKLSQLALERARREYQALVDSLTDMVYVLDSKGVFTFASAAAERLLGVPATSLVGTRFGTLVEADDLHRATAAAREHLKSTDHGMREIQLRLRRRDGSVRHMECRWHAPLDGVRRDAAAVGVMRDVTERVELVERLQRQMAAVESARADYRALVDSLSDVVMRLDAQTGTIMFVSAAVEDVFGVSPDSLIGTRAYDHILAEDVDRVIAASRAGLKGPDSGVVQQHYRVSTPAGPRHVEARFRKTPRGLDGRKQVVGVVRDIEERVQLEHRLAEEMERLRSIVQSSAALIVLADRHLNVVMVNTGFTVMTGVPAHRAIGQSLREVLEWPVGRAPDQPQQFAVKFDVLGSMRLISVSATPVFGADGKLSNIMLLGIDDTERREAERALYNTERFATVGEMAATMAHEISQPLQVINIACESAREELGEGSLDVDFQKAKLERIAQQVVYASRTIGDLRAFVRGIGAPEDEGPFDAGLAVKSAIDLTAHSLRQAGIALSFSPAHGLSTVRGHVGRLELVLVNLINNACDTGGRTIDIVVQPIERDGKRLVQITVDDTGPGIPAEVTPRLFVSFVTTKAKGTGLGLRICRRIVEEMGGEISATNRPEGGARFEVLLPAAMQ
jgi:PAS domain S-box-containing protein